MQISFHGAARSVTGSCHMVTCNGKNILIDCGLYQGSRALAEENANDFGFDPASIDFLLLTHAHLDHCGRIPLLVKQGFAGRVLCTSATRELTRLVLLDSAKIQEEDAKYQNYKAAKRKNPGPPVEPLYTTVDALNVFDFFVDIARWENRTSLPRALLSPFTMPGTSWVRPVFCCSWKKMAKSAACFFPVTSAPATGPLCPTRPGLPMPTWW